MAMTHALELSDMETYDLPDVSESSALLAEASSQDSDGSQDLEAGYANGDPSSHVGADVELDLIVEPDLSYEDELPLPEAPTWSCRRWLQPQVLPFIRGILSLVALMCIIGSVFRISKVTFLTKNRIIALALVTALGSCSFIQYIYMLGALPCFKRKWIENGAIFIIVMSLIISLAVVLPATFDMVAVFPLWGTVIAEALFYAYFAKPLGLADIPPNELLRMRPEQIETLHRPPPLPLPFQT